jgi:hypothetical protein
LLALYLDATTRVTDDGDLTFLFSLVHEPFARVDPHPACALVGFGACIAVALAFAIRL